MKKLISCILIFALLCSLSVSAFAELSTGENAGAQLKLIANSFGMLRQPVGKDPWYYAVTDLDHNGRLELLACRKDSETGDGYVRGWELTPDGQRLEALHTPFENESANPDYFFNIITDSADAYYDAAKNVWFYIFTNNLLVDMPEYDLNMLSTFTCGLSMINGMLYDGYLGSKVVTTTGGQTTVSYSGQDEKELTEAEFLNLANTSFAGYQRSSISFDWFPASAATNLSRFADSYAVFSGDRTGVQERVNLTAPNVPNTASYVTPLVITKNPTNEQRYVGETAWFVANATGYNSLYWTLVSPWGQEYSIAEIRSQPLLSGFAAHRYTLGLAVICAYTSLKVPTPKYSSPFCSIWKPSGRVTGAPSFTVEKKNMPHSVKYSCISCLTVILNSFRRMVLDYQNQHQG